MFKFRSTLVQQLWRYVQCTSLEASEEDQDLDLLHDQSSSSKQDDQRPLHEIRPLHARSRPNSKKKQQIRAMLMRLKKANLETLFKAVQSKGADPGSCVMIPVTNNLSSSSSAMASHVVLSQVFRWPDLQSESELKRLSFCHNQDKIISDHFKNQPKLYECCNPYHWSRLIKPSK